MAIELDNSFTVPVPPEQAWDVLLDVERIAPCMPGASVLSISDDGDEIEGQVKVKLGPLSLTYKGTAKFTDKDQANHTISIEATGKETRGAGTASANVQATLKADEAGTLVSIHTSLNVTGRPAQFGRSLLPEVSGKLIAQFASNLQALIASDDAATETAPAAEGGDASSEAEAGASVTTAVKPAAPAPKQEESLNAFKFVVVPVLKRVIPVAAIGAAIAIAIRKLTGRGKPKK
jgi:carbon monoxide dehydrogenase subunit G